MMRDKFARSVKRKHVDVVVRLVDSCTESIARAVRTRAWLEVDNGKVWYLRLGYMDALEYRGKNTVRGWLQIIRADTGEQVYPRGGIRPQLHSGFTLHPPAMRLDRSLCRFPVTWKGL